MRIFYKLNEIGKDDMCRILFSIMLIAVPLISGVADAQIRLPSLPLPTPSIGDLPEARTSIRNTEIGVDTRMLIGVRITRQREQVRRYPDILELDPAGSTVVRGQLVAIGPSAEALAAIVAAGFLVAGERELAGLETKVVILRPPLNLTLVAALARLREIDPVGIYDYNHIYSDSGNVTALQFAPAAQRDSAGGSAASSAIRIGLIDGGVDRSHPALRNTTINQWGCAGKNVTSAHGTAVASIMAGYAGKFQGVAPNATLYAADVYCGAPAGGAVDAIVEALAWMARERVAVINLSLVGPPNLTLERILKIISARGHIVVAAVGNDGPAAPPLYPAGYAEVVAVTAVDARQRVLPEACRGPHVAFAAPGSEMVAADDKGRLVEVRGTSFAAPIVAALLARELTVPDRAVAAWVIAALAKEATDLGASGRDPVFGYGLVGMKYRNPPQRAR